MDKLKVLEATQISPPPGFVPPSSSLPCTSFDLIYVGHPEPFHFLFFYKTLLQPKTILPNLKQSLSLTLKHYYPLAGNLKWPQGSFFKPELVYSDGDSIALTIAESELDFDKLSGAHAREIDTLVPLFPRMNAPSCSSDQKLLPLLAVQLTFFPDKGICIGLALISVADSKSIFSFVKTWSSIYSSSTAGLSPPFYDRSTILKGFEKEETVMLDLLKEQFNKNKGTVHTPASAVHKDLVQAAFTLSRSRIQRLKRWISASVGMSSLHFSSFSVTCAFLWVCSIKARQKGNTSPNTTEHLLLPMDVRTRLDPPVPSTYFGTCSMGFGVKAERSQLLGEQGIVTAAKIIQQGIQNVDVYEELHKQTSYYPFLPHQQMLVIGSYPKLGAYGADFGWGKPKRVEMASVLATGCIFLNDHPYDEGGITIGFLCKAVEYHPFASAFANSPGSQDLLLSMM